MNAGNIGKYILSTGILVLFLCSITFAQETTVQGTVTDSNSGQPLIGVNIGVQGTSRGTITDEQGHYTLSVPSAQDTLFFSYIGYERQIVPVNERTTIDVAMEPKVVKGQELVVIGYGARQKENLVGSVSNIGTKEISEEPALTATGALQGKVPGVNIIQNHAPGGSPTVIMRGLGTALGGRNPLYIVDGIPADNINNIAPSDIKSMSFLKDAAAASIYGLRAANGVIIVTTKNGQAGKPQFSVNSYAGYKAILGKVEMANADQYIQYTNEGQMQKKKYLGASNTIQLSPDHQYNTDWYNELLSPGYVVNTTASVAGGSDNITYYFSYNLHKTKGILAGQNFWRQTLRNNNKYHLFNDFLEIDQNINVSFSKEIPKPFSAFDNAYDQAPIVPVRFSNGRYGRPLVNSATGKLGFKAPVGVSIHRLNDKGNPVAIVNLSNEKQKTIQLQGKVSAILNLTDYLTFTSRLGVTKFFANNRTFNPIEQRWLAQDPTRTKDQFDANKDANPNSTNWAYNSYFKLHNETLHWNWDNFFNFSDTFGKHTVNATLGMSSEKVGKGFKFSGLAYDVPNKEQYWSLNLASDQYDKVVNQLYYTPNTLLSFFGRAQYNYDHRYYVMASLRRDGSSKFANTGNYWELFPAFSAAWNVTNEDFMNSSGILNLLKIRASWGKLGNQNVPFNTTTIQTAIGSASMNYVFGPGQRLVYGAIVGAPAHPISWEIVDEWDVGLDYGLLDSRLIGSLDFYRKTTENVILQITPVPDSPFQSNFYDEGGEVVNQGVEFAINWSDNISKDLSYNIGFNISYNHNELTSVKKNYGGLTGGDLLNGNSIKRLSEGEPLGSWWMYQAVGVWQTQNEIDSHPHLGSAAPGRLRYKDQNDDGKINNADKVYLGSYVPKYHYGINIGLNYKRIDFKLNATGVTGNKVYNALKNKRRGGENITKEVFENRWTGPGSTNKHPGADHGYVASNYYLESGAYLRINNITLGYTIPSVSDHVGDIRLYISAQNPFVFTKYSGFTPELIGNGRPYGSTGIELGAYPTTRTFLFGINIDLQ